MKIERKYMAHFLNAAFGSGTASYCRLGNDLEEYSPELSANVEKKNNILGQTRSCSKSGPGYYFAFAHWR